MNAIILAAGLGSRFKEITKKTHKALLPIGEIPNIERTIRYLRDFGINDITVITGHLHQQFDYLSEKYDCQLIFNEKYSEYNNIYSFFLAEEKLSETFVIDADVVLLDNIFEKHEFSHYYTIQREQSEDKEWIPVLDKNGVVKSMQISNDYLPSMLGISYWNQEDSTLLKKELKQYIRLELLKNPKLYWDKIPVAVLSKMSVRTIEINSTKAGEMDTIENYLTICKQLK